jgi:hypothetical protein
MTTVVSVVRHRFNQLMTVENGERALALASTCTLGGATFSQLIGQGLSKEFAAVTAVASAYITKNGAISKSEAGKALLTGLSFVLINKAAKALIAAGKQAKTGIDKTKKSFESMHEITSIFFNKQADPTKKTGKSQEVQKPMPAQKAEETYKEKRVQAFVKNIALMILTNKQTKQLIASWVVYRLIKHCAPSKVKELMKKLPF